jgi:putative membrane protein
MDKMFEAGFLGTRAPLFMDIVTVIVALLPFLIAGVIFVARRKKYSLHGILQRILFWISLIVVAYFEYGVRTYGGFDVLIEGSSTPYSYAFLVLITHILIAVTTLGLWIYILQRAKRDRRMNVLPGMNSIDHKRAGARTFIAISLTSFSGLWVYYLLFIN